MTFRTCIFIALLLATSNAQAAQFRSAAGFGLQYAGVVGWQGSLQAGDNNLYLSVGLLGLAAGYQYSMTDKLTIGLQGFAIGLASGGGINLNYHFSGTRSRGWMVGLDIFSARSTLNDSKTDRRGSISFGFVF